MGEGFHRIYGDRPQLRDCLIEGLLSSMMCRVYFLLAIKKV